MYSDILDLVISPRTPIQRFLVWCPKYGQSVDDACEITAMDDGDAAEEWAERYEREDTDYPILNGQDVTVRVRDIETGTETVFVVSGEIIPSYSAVRITEEEASARPDPIRGPFPMMSLDDGEPPTDTDLFFFWCFLLGAAAIWIAGLIRIGYWLASLPTSAQSNADWITGMLIGIGIGILLVSSLYRPVSRADRASESKRTPE
jgi:hypothetical protein